MAKRKVSQEDAESLAVRYSAYRAALDEGNDNDIVMWGTMLADLEDKLGFRVGHNVRIFVEMIKERMARDKARETAKLVDEYGM